MTRLQTMRRIVLPQAMRVIIPPTGNETISMLKTTLARQRHRAVEPGPALLGAADLLGQLPDDPAADRRQHLVPDRHDVLTIGQYYLERHFGRGATRATLPTTPLQRLRRNLLHATGRQLVSEPMVKAEGVHKRFGRLEVLKGVSLEVQHGEVVCMIGPSGSGKSTFLRCINHLEKIDAGRLWVDGELVGYRQAGRQALRAARARGRRASGPRSAWSSSASTSSAT